RSTSTDSKSGVRQRWCWRNFSHCWGGDGSRNDRLAQLPALPFPDIMHVLRRSAQKRRVHRLRGIFSTKPWLHGKFNTFVHMLAVQARLGGDVMGSAVLTEAISAIRDWSVTETRETRVVRPTETFGSLVFSDAVQQTRLPKPVYHAL